MAQQFSETISTPSFAPSPDLRVPQIYLAGNPNAGKTMLFNILAQQNAKVANFPGVSVEIRRADLVLPLSGRCQLVDLPGTYSIYPCSEDESVATLSLLRSCSAGSRDIILAVLDATNLERNLYFLCQLVELGKPIVAALTMMDLMTPGEQNINVEELRRLSGITIIPLSSVTGIGISELKRTLDGFILNPRVPPSINSLPEVMDAQHVIQLGKSGNLYRRQWGLSGANHHNYGLLAYFDNSHVEGGVHRLKWPDHLIETVARSIEQRYQRVQTWIQACHPHSPGECRVRGSLFTRAPAGDRATNKLDAIFLHAFVGPIILVLIFASMFTMLFSWLDPIVGVIEDITGFLAAAVHNVLPPDSIMASLLADGVIAGIGSVLAFVPLIATLFLFLGILEDSGYLARATYLLDRVMRKVGLSGKAFIPLLSGFACAVPAIMSTRVIESRSSRLITILVTPLMSCSARLPIYGLLIASLFASSPPLFGFINAGAAVMMLMYSLGMVCAFLVAALLRKFVFKNSTPSLIMELPSYRLPRASSLIKNVSSRVKIFLREVGTVILAMSIVMWALFTFPRADNQSPAGDGAQDSQIINSYAGQLGHALEPVIAPLGFNWKIGVGILASFAAREVFVSTLGVIYGLGDGAEGESNSLRNAIRSDINPVTNKPVFTPLIGLSLMVFFALSMQCMSTLVATRRETGNWGWPMVQLVYMSVLAWLSSFMVFQVGTLLGYS